MTGCLGEIDAYTGKKMMRLRRMLQLFWNWLKDKLHVYHVYFDNFKGLDILDLLKKNIYSCEANRLDRLGFTAAFKSILIRMTV